MEVLFFLSLILIAADGAASGKCLKQHNKTQLLGAFKPSCNPDGTYKEIQCQESYCFCVDKESGEEIFGTGTMGVVPTCPKPKATQNCFDRSNINAEPLLGAYTPECHPDGTYKEVQCYEGYCFCVDKASGEEINGKRHRGPPPNCKKGACQTEVDKIDKRLIGAFIPKCKADGSYEGKQCHGSTGHCWCVESTIGKEISGTRKGAGKGQVMCVLGACQKELAKVNKTILGVYIPKCKADGSYEEKQCHGSTGHCWCVESKMGKEISGTRKGPGKGRVTCAVAEKNCLSHRRSSKLNGLLGAYTPQCNPDATYKEKQCHERSCFCVNRKTGEEILGTRKRGLPKICDSACIRDRHEKLKFAISTSFLGVPTPRCTDDGKYENVQCFKGICWKAS